jgi:hypothetical protein
MEMNPKDIRINHFYLGPGKGSSFEVVHLPTGVSVSEAVPTNSTEQSQAITARLLSLLKLKSRRMGRAKISIMTKPTPLEVGS